MTRTKLILLCGLAIAVALVGFFGVHLFGQKDTVRTALAERFGVAPEYLHLNLPPATGRYPGAVFAGTDRLIPLGYMYGNDDRLQRGSAISLAIELDAESLSTGSLGLGFFDQLSTSGKTTSMSLHIRDVVPIEMTGGALKAALLESDDAANAAMNNTPVYVISKAYEGQMEVSLTTADNVAANAVIREIDRAMPDAEASVEVKGTGRSSVLVRFSGSTVFAYELMEASFFSTSLSITPTDVSLTPLPASDAPPPAPTSADEPAASFNWGLFTIASGVYPQQPTLNQSWNRASAETVGARLAAFAPSVTTELHATEAVPLTVSGVERTAEMVAAEAREKAIDLLVVYFVGHMVRRRDGELVLVTGESTFASLQDTTVPALTVRSLYDRLDAAGRPFALLIDGCLEDERIDVVRESLGFVLRGGYGQMDYIGSASLITDELRSYADELDKVAEEHDYLHTDNPVILGSKPGAVAPGVADPANVWGPRHGPLAERIVRMSRVMAARASNRPLHELLRGTVDFNHVGELTAAGTISWSDFSKFRKSGLRATQPDLATQLNTTPFDPGIDRLTPFADQSGFWVHDFNGDVWRWSTAIDERIRIVREQHSTEVVAIPGTEKFALYDGWEYKVSVHAESVDDGQTLVEDLGVNIIKGHPNPSLLIVEGNGDLSKPDRIFRATADGAEVILVTETEEFFDVVDGPEGTVFASIPERGVIALLSKDEFEIYASSLIEPTQLARTPSHLYAISGDGLTVMQVDEHRNVKAIRVDDHIQIPDVPYHPRRNFTVFEDGTMNLAIGGIVRQMNVEALPWAPL